MFARHPLRVRRIACCAFMSSERIFLPWCFLPCSYLFRCNGDQRSGRAREARAFQAGNHRGAISEASRAALTWVFTLPSKATKRRCGLSSGGKSGRASMVESTSCFFRKQLVTLNLIVLFGCPMQSLNVTLGRFEGHVLRRRVIH